MSYPHLAARLYDVPLMITPAKAEVWERVFRAHAEGTSHTLPSFERPERHGLDLAMGGGGAQRTQSGFWRTGDGMAVIQIVGSLVQRGGGMDALSGIESYDSIASQLSAAMTDPMVRGVLLEIDSPGGEGAGVFDLAAQIRAMDKEKPITAHANEKAFSAAYALGASAGKLLVARTGMVGSVGVVLLHVDQSIKDAKQGIVYTPIFAGSHKVDFNPHVPLSDAALNKAQNMVDRLYETFVEHVAGARSMDPQDVRDTEAAVLHPDQAQAIKMIDGVATLQEALQSLRQRVADLTPNSSFSFYTRAASAQTEETQMAITQAPAATVATTFSAEQLETEREAAFAKGQAEASKLSATAAQTERERISAIMGHAESDGRRKLAEHLAFKTGSSVEDAISVLAAAPKEAAVASNPLAAAMQGVPNPKVDADVDSSTEYKPKLNAEQIYKNRRITVVK